MDFGCYIDWLDHWQTMLSGGGAIIAGIASVVLLRSQIKQTADLETARRAQSFSGARARLTGALNAVAVYARDSAKYLAKYYKVLGNYEAVYSQKEVPCPLPPSEAIEAIITAIETTDDSAFAKFLSDLIADIQVHDARLSEAPALFARSASRSFIHDLIVAAGALYMTASSGLPFARRETEDKPVEVDRGMKLLGIDRVGFRQIEYPLLWRHIEGTLRAEAAKAAPASPASEAEPATARS